MTQEQGETGPGRVARLDFWLLFKKKKKDREIGQHHSSSWDSGLGLGRPYRQSTVSPHFATLPTTPYY